MEGSVDSSQAVTNQILSDSQFYVHVLVFYIIYSLMYFRLGEELRAIAGAPQHMPKIILGLLLSRTWDTRLVLIFKLQH